MERHLHLVEVFNFCEVSTSIPSAREQSIEYAKKTGFGNLGFQDSPSLRLVLAVSKGDNSHSSTAVGKASMLGNQLRACNPNGSKFRMELASYMQDSCLGATSMPDPKYLPGIMGGCGVPSLFGNPVNDYLYVKAFKGGSYSRVYGTATEEAKDAVFKLDMGIPADVVLCNRLRQKQDYLHGTYANLVLVPPETLGGLRTESLPPPLYGKMGTNSLVAGCEMRLLRTKRLLTQSSALLEIDRTWRLQQTLVGLMSVETSERAAKEISRAGRKRFDGALSSNAAFVNLLNRKANGSEVETLIREGFHPVTTGVMAFTKENAKWLFYGGRGQGYNIADIPSSEDMYVRDEVSMEVTMKISGIPISPIFNRRPPAKIWTVTRLGLWQIDGDQEQWADRIVNRLSSLRRPGHQTLDYSEVIPVLEEDREWVSDDTYIIGAVSRDTAEEPRSQTVLLISSDKRLANQLAQTTANFVVRIEPGPLALKLGLSTMSSTTVIPIEMVTSLLRPGFFSDKMIPEPNRMYIDTGSVSATLLRMGKEQNSLGSKVNYYHRELTSAGYTSNGRVSEVRRLLLDPDAISIKVDVIWPNTIKMEFEERLLSVPLGRDREKTSWINRPRRLMKKYLS